MVSQHGRPDDGTDAAGLFNAEFFAPLKPASEWPDHPRQGRADRAAADAAAGEIPRRRIQLLAISAGQRLRSRVGREGRELDQALRQRGAGADRHRQQDQVGAGDGAGRHRPRGGHLARAADHPDRRRSRARARYGLSPGDINATIKVAVGGDTAGDLYEPGSDRHFPIIVRLAPEYRKSAEAIQNLRIGVANPNGGITQIRSAKWPRSSSISGAAYIYREQQERYLPIKFSVRERDLGSAIQEAQQKIAETQVQLPPARSVEWVGEFGNLQDAIRRLSIVVPISLALIAVLLFFNFGSMVDTLLAMSVIPMAIFGGVLGLLDLRDSVRRVGGDRLHRAVRHCRDGRHHHPVAVQPADRRRLRPGCAR